MSRFGKFDFENAVRFAPPSAQKRLAEQRAATERLQKLFPLVGRPCGNTSVAFKNTRDEPPMESPEADPELSPGGGGGAGIQVFNPVNGFTEQNDTITEMDAPGTVIAKPWHLRGFIRFRSLTGEAQWIVPAYSAGSAADELRFVVAANVGEAATGIAGVDWLDINALGRLWVIA